MYARGELRIIGRLHRDSVAACDAAHDPEGQPVLLITGLVPATDAELAAYTRWAWRLANCSRHPYIADVVCHGVTDRRPYLGVRTGQRQTLAEWLARHRRLPYQQVRLLGSALAEALATAHGAGLCHLAVRPEVIYLDEEASPVLTGFDAGAPVLVRPMATGSLSAPEFRVPRGGIGTGGPLVGAPADVYALCATLYLALGGGPPMAGGDAAWLDSGRPAVHLPGLPGVPGGLLDVLRHGMAGYPAHRPTAARLREALLAPWGITRTKPVSDSNDVLAALGGPVTPLLPPSATPPSATPLDDPRRTAEPAAPSAAELDESGVRPLVGAWRVETDTGSQELLLVTEPGTVIWTGSDDAGPFVATGEVISLGDGEYRLLLNEPAGAAGFYVDLRLGPDGWSFLMDQGPADGLVSRTEPL
ncbi:MAG TPA: hypothetical protein VHJ83_05065 [Micromonosporaceae bacterium]|nr:hypothetical protein [Micromonosporaceae bacterium]